MFQKYNLQNVRTTSDWYDFPFDEVTLKEFWNESTYRLEEGYFLSALSAFQYSEYYYCWNKCFIYNTVKCRLYSLKTPALQTKIRGTRLHQ
jgi:hypothetical protein